MQDSDVDLRVILQGIVGSTAYGLANADSDIDRLGVYVAPIEDVLGLHSPAATTHSVVRKDPDRTHHEVGKYLSLALKGNPTILELLWLPQHEITTEAGLTLLDVRADVLSEKRVRDAYTGYALQQAHRLVRRNADGKAGFDSDTGKRTAKHGRHCWRLLLAAEELLGTGRLTVDASASRNDIFEAGRAAEENPERFRDRVITHVESIDRMRSVLPDYPNTAAVEAALLHIRRNNP